MKLRHRVTFVIIGLAMAIASVALSIASGQEVAPLRRAHAHNDYEHKRPLLDALELGFTSIEADVYLVDNQLLVAHNLRDTRPDRTLESLYLKPLFERFKNGGRVLSDGGSLTLLVDIKSAGEETFAVLSQQLSTYAEMLSTTVDGVYKEGAVTVIISGNRPINAITASNPRFVGIDGRLQDLEGKAPASLYPLISDNWLLNFRYLGLGEISPEEREKIKKIVSLAHAQGRRLRFWATPESPALWNELIRLEVDLIGTDDLPQLSNFLRQQPTP